jgi:hypothetical protein
MTNYLSFVLYLLPGILDWHLTSFTKGRYMASHDEAFRVHVEHYLSSASQWIDRPESEKPTMYLATRRPYSVVDIDRFFEAGCRSAASRGPVSAAVRLGYAFIGSNAFHRDQLWDALKLLGGRMHTRSCEIVDRAIMKKVSNDGQYSLLLASGLVREQFVVQTACARVAVGPRRSVLFFSLNDQPMAMAYCASAALRQFVQETAAYPSK